MRKYWRQFAFFDDLLSSAPRAYTDSCLLAIKHSAAFLQRVSDYPVDDRVESFDAAIFGAGVLWDYSFCYCFRFYFSFLIVIFIRFFFFVFFMFVLSSHHVSYGHCGGVVVWEASLLLSLAFDDCLRCCMCSQ